jgi:Domain of unknown function (DUF4328)
VTVSSDGMADRPAMPRSTVGLAHWLSAVLVLCGLSVVITIDSLAYEVNNLSAAAQGSPVESELHLAHERVHDSGALAIGFAVIAVVLLLVWQFLAQSNLRRFGERKLRFPPAVAVLAWLLPGLNLLLPALAMRELWKRSDPDAGTLDGRAPRTSPMVGIWWIVLLATAAAIWSALRADTAGVLVLLHRERLLLAACGLGLGAIVLTAILAERIAARQSIRTNQAISGSWANWRRP